MGEELIEIMERFKLSDKETKGTCLKLIDVQGGVKECELSLIGKVIGDKVVNIDGIRNLTKQVWGYQ